MVACAAGPKDTALWETVLHDSFATLKEFSFLNQSNSEGMWRRLVAAVLGAQGLTLVWITLHPGVLLGFGCSLAWSTFRLP
jgi:hypothetical protein